MLKDAWHNFIRQSQRFLLTVTVIVPSHGLQWGDDELINTKSLCIPCLQVTRRRFLINQYGVNKQVACIQASRVVSNFHRRREPIAVKGRVKRLESFRVSSCASAKCSVLRRTLSPSINSSLRFLRSGSNCCRSCAFCRLVVAVANAYLSVFKQCVAASVVSSMRPKFVGIFGWKPLCK